MAVFIDHAITDSGVRLQAQIMQTGAAFVPTKMVVGSGKMPDGESAKTMTEVVAPEQEISIVDIERMPDGSSVAIAGVFTNKTVTAPFLYRELGLYAKGILADGTETEEVLYSYGNAGDTPDPIPAYNTENLIETVLRLIVYIGNETEIKLEVESGAYVTLEKFNRELGSLISDETIDMFSRKGIDISEGGAGGDSGEDPGGDSGDDSGGSGEDSGGDTGEDPDDGDDSSGGDTIGEDDIATDEEVDEMIKDIFG